MMGIFYFNRENTYPHICFFKDKKPYYCWGANQDELSMEPFGKLFETIVNTE